MVDKATAEEDGPEEDTGAPLYLCQFLLRDGQGCRVHTVGWIVTSHDGERRVSSLGFGLSE